MLGNLVGDATDRVFTVNTFLIAFLKTATALEGKATAAYLGLIVDFRFSATTVPAAAFMQSAHHPTPSVVDLPFVLVQSLHSIPAISLTPNKTRVKCKFYAAFISFR